MTEALFEQVGPYSIDKSSRKVYSGFRRNDKPSLTQYRAVRDELAFSAKCIQKDYIGNAAKRKSFQKWNAQVKIAAQVVASPTVLTTLQVVKTPLSYWFFQDYDPATTVSLADYILSRTCQEGQNQVPLFRVDQLVFMAQQVAQTMAELHRNTNFIHGNLDPGSVFVVNAQQSEDLSIKLDLIENHQLTQLLKSEAQSQAAPAQVIPGSAHLQSKMGQAFNQLRNTTKITVQSDIQALGQLILLLMNHTDLESTCEENRQVLADMVKSCSFDFKAWEDVLSHAFFSLDVLQETAVASGPGKAIEKAGQDVQVDPPELELEPEPELVMPELQESMIMQESSYQVQAQNQACEEESKTEAKDLGLKLLSSAALCEDLEKLLETGFAELINSQALDESQYMDESQVETHENMDSEIDGETPFPKGKTVYDDDEEGSPCSTDAELDDGYEVICAQEVTRIPSPQQRDPQPKSALRQGTTYMMGRAGKLISSFFR